MTAEEYRAALAAVGLSQARLGRLLELNKSTPNDWAMGRAAVPAAVALVLKLLAAGDVTIERLEAL